MPPGDHILQAAQKLLEYHATLAHTDPNKFLSKDNIKDTDESGKIALFLGGAYTHLTKCMSDLLAKVQSATEDRSAWLLLDKASKISMLAAGAYRACTGLILHRNLCELRDLDSLLSSEEMRKHHRNSYKWAALAADMLSSSPDFYLLSADARDSAALIENCQLVLYAGRAAFANAAVLFEYSKNRLCAIAEWQLKAINAEQDAQRLGLSL